MERIMKCYPVFPIFILAMSTPAFGTIIVPGADGSDGAFNPSSNTIIQLADSPTGFWNAPNPEAPALNPLTGAYDPNKWAVVFRYTSVDIPVNVTVTFANHPSRAPVVLLVSGDVNIAGTVSLDGGNGHAHTGPAQVSEPGPGGFRGGVGNQSATFLQSGGFGPGGTHNLANNSHACGGSYGSLGLCGFGGGPYNGGPLFGNDAIIPLIGGSGGTGLLRLPGSTSQDGGGGAGGGAILIAATGTITIDGTLRANGGGSAYFAGSGGSGGAIRLVADQVTGAGVVRAIGGFGFNSGNGGDGRLRIERVGGTLTGVPNPSFAPPGAVATIWPAASAPTVKLTMVHDQVVPADPHASLDFPAQDVTLNNPNAMTIRAQCTNVPINSSVKIRVVPRGGTDCLAGTGADCTYVATFLGGDENSSIWQAANVQLPDGLSILQARVVLP
jgi:hypothetical protein